MKRNLLGMCLVALLACAGTAWADLGVVAQDDAGNYTPESFNSGANEGTGFGPWETVFCNDDQSTIFAGATIVTTCADESVLTGGQAFALYANGADGAEIQFRRPFATALDDGQAFSVVLSPNYRDGTKGLKFMGAWEGEWYLRAEFFYNNDGYFYKIDGDENATSLDWKYDTGAITVTLEKAVDGSGYTLSFARGEETAGKEGITFPGTVDGVQFYSWQGGTGDENNLVFNSLAIEQVANPPADRLSLEGDGFVVEYTSELSLKVLRTKSEGTLDVTLDSSYPEFVSVPTTVTISGGDTEATFTANAMLRGNANSATITASADGFAIAKKEIKGPNYSCTAYEAGVEHPEVLVQGGTRDFYVNNLWKEGWAEANNNKVSLRSTDQSVVKITRIGNWQEDERGSYSKCEISAVGPGEATVEVSYAGPKMCEYKFTVLPPFQLSGPATAKTGDTKTYTLKAALDGEEVGWTVSVDPAAAAEVDPASFDLVEPAEDGFYYQDITVTFNQAAEVTLSVASLNYPNAASATVTVSEPADYSEFIAYDEASFYGDDFDSAALGEGTDKFQAWEEVTKNSGGVFIAGSAPDASVLTEGKAFGIWANGADDAELQLRRPFVNSLGDGQAFSVVVSPNYRDGTKGVKFMGEWEGNWYTRAEFFYNNDGYFYKLDGDADATSLDWGYSATAIAITLQKAADGSGYTLSFTRGEETAAKKGITFPGTVDGVQFYSYQGGNGDDNNLVFNKLAIEQVEAPVRKIWLSGDNNPDGPGDIVFTLGANTDDIGVVALAVSEGASVSPSSIDLSGLTEATFTVTLATAETGSVFTVTATPADTEVDPYSFDIYPVAPHSEILSVSGVYEMDYVPDGTVVLKIVGTASRVGQTVYLDDPNSDILVPPSPATAVVGPFEGDSPTFVYTMAGIDEGTVFIHAYADEEKTIEWGWVGITIKGKGLSSITGNPVFSKDKKTVTLTSSVTPPPVVYGATELVARNWDWAPIEGVTVDGSQVTIDISGKSFQVFSIGTPPSLD